jgi:LacI family transcriptional regulator
VALNGAKTRDLPRSRQSDMVHNGDMPSLRKPSRGSHRGITIHDVARKAGVSPMTVSRVVNGERNVRETTREAVLAAVKDLRYAPNPAARSLAGAESARIGLLYSNPSAAYLSEFLLGALDESSRKSAQLMLEKCEVSSAAGERAAVRRLIEGGVAGVILPPPICESHVILTELKKADIPTVAVATGRFRTDASCVRIDDFKAAYEMTRYLLGLGHRRIGFIKGHPNQTASGQRWLGFETAIREADNKVDPPSIEQGFFTYRSGLDAAEKLLSIEPRLTAIFASNDDMAAAVVSVAHRRGLEVPRDLSVVGFDDTATATTVWPELTTIRQPIAEMAEAALDILIQKIKKHRGGESLSSIDRLVPHEVVVRQSAAAPGTT